MNFIRTLLFSSRTLVVPASRVYLRCFGLLAVYVFGFFVAVAATQPASAQCQNVTKSNTQQSVHDGQCPTLHSGRKHATREPCDPRAQYGAAHVSR